MGDIDRRRQQVAQMRASGMKPAAIARQLGISYNTARNDVRSIEATAHVPADERDEHGERHQAAHDRAQILQMRVKGFSPAEIAWQTGITLNAVHKHLERSLAMVCAPRAAELRSLELARLDRWLTKLENGIEAGDPESIRTAISISKRRADLLGLDATKQIEHHVVTQDAIDAEIERLTGQLARLEGSVVEGEVVEGAEEP